MNRTPKASIWRERGMPALLAATALGFTGYAVLITVTPLWAVAGEAGPVGAGFVNGTLMLFTVLAQAFVPAALRRFGWGPTLAFGLLLLGGASLPQLISNQLGVLLVLAAVRGLGFGVLTVVGSAAVAVLVEPARHGRAIGAYGLAIALPQLVLLPFAPWLAQNVGFALVFAIGACPLLGIPAAFVLARRIDAAHAAHAAAVAVAGAASVAAESVAAESAASGSTPVSPGPAVPRAESGRSIVLVRLMRPVLLLLGVTLAGGAMLTFAPQLSSDPTATIIGLFLLTAVTALCRWRFGALADRYGARRFLWPLVLVTTVGMALIAWAVVDAGATRVVPFLAGLAMLGISYGGLQNLTLVEAFAAVDRRHYSLASAVWNTGFDAGTGIGSVLLGLLAGALTFPSALLVCAAISLATLPLALARGRGRAA